MERHNNLFVLVLIFIPVQLQAAGKWCACEKSCWDDASYTKSSANGECLFLQLPTVTQFH